MPPLPRRRAAAWLHGDAAALALLAAVFLGANWPLLTGQASERCDGAQFFAPFYHHVASLARAGHLLLWNPFSNGGSPDGFEPQVGAFSPVLLGWALAFGSGPGAFHLYWLGVWLSGGVGMYVLARALAAPPWGALVVSLGFVFSGFYVGQAVHLSAIYSFSFVPWIMWRVRAALVTGRRWPAAEAGALWGLSALAGNPAVVLPAALFLGAAAPAFLPPVAPGASPRARWRAYGEAMILLAGVGALALLPAYAGFAREAAGYSHRALPLPRELVLNQGYGPSWLTALFTPAFVSYREALPGWAEFDVSMRPLYGGAALPVLAALTVWRRRGDWRAWVLLGAGLGCLGVAMGTALPLRGWLYDLVPPTRFLRHPAMFRAFFILALAMLAAPGTALVDAALRARRGAADRSLRPLAALAAGGALLAGAAYLWVSALLTDALAARVPPSAPLHLALAWVGLLALCLLAARRPGFRRFLPGALAALTAVDLTLAFAYTAHAAYDPHPSAAADGPIGPLDDLGARGWDRALAVPGNGNLYTRAPVFVTYTAMRNLFQEDWGLDRGLRRCVVGPQRVWFAAGVPTVPATPEAYAAFKARAHALGAMPVVRQLPASLLRPGAGLSASDRAAVAAAPAALPAACEVLAYRANGLALRAACPADGFLLVTERWARGWEATVNGQPVPVDGGDFLFRLVPVRAGGNLVEMRFSVGWLYPLLALSWGTLAAVAAGSAWQSRRVNKPAVRAGAGIKPASVEEAAGVAS